jgi:hypothetical protein
MKRFLFQPLALLILPSALWAWHMPEEEKSSAAGEYKALVDRYRDAQRESDAVFDKARTEEERREIRSAFARTRSRFVGRFLAFAEAHPRNRETLLALFFILHPDTQSEASHLDAAVRLILKDHITSDRLTDPPILQLVEDAPAAERLLRGVLAQNPHRAVQAQACLSLALMLKGRATPRPPAGRPPERAALFTREAEELFERVVTEYAGVEGAAEKARAELFEIRHLAVGKVAPDIKGTDSGGKEFRLSAYRGKVVLLDFWAGW